MSGANLSALQSVMTAQLSSTIGTHHRTSKSDSASTGISSIASILGANNAASSSSPLSSLSSLISSLDGFSNNAKSGTISITI